MTEKRGVNLWRIFWITGALISVLRIGTLSILVVATLKGQATFDLVPVTFLVLPEAWIVPLGTPFTPWSVTLISMTLVAGSFIIALVVTALFALGARGKVTG